MQQNALFVKPKADGILFIFDFDLTLTKNHTYQSPFRDNYQAAGNNNAQVIADNLKPGVIEMFQSIWERGGQFVILTHNQYPELIQSHLTLNVNGLTPEEIENIMIIKTPLGTKKSDTFLNYLNEEKILSTVKRMAFLDDDERNISDMGSAFSHFEDQFSTCLVEEVPEEDQDPLFLFVEDMLTKGCSLSDKSLVGLHEKHLSQQMLKQRRLEMIHLAREKASVLATEMLNSFEFKIEDGHFKKTYTLYECSSNLITDLRAISNAIKEKKSSFDEVEGLDSEHDHDLESLEGIEKRMIDTLSISSLLGRLTMKFSNLIETACMSSAIPDNMDELLHLNSTQLYDELVGVRNHIEQFKFSDNELKEQGLQFIDTISSEFLGIENIDASSEEMVDEIEKAILDRTSEEMSSEEFSSEKNFFC